MIYLVFGRVLLHTPTEGDHSISVPDFEKLGVPVLAPEHVFNSFNMKPSVVAIQKKKYHFGGYSIIPFNAFHDVPTLGYFIHHSDMGNLVFITDSFMTENVFKNVNHILIECNYSDEALDEAIACGHTHLAMKKRLMTTHMELGTTVKFLKAHDLSNVYNIILLHLSKFNSDRKQFIEVIAQKTGRIAMIAEAGMKVELANNPY